MRAGRGRKAVGAVVAGVVATTLPGGVLTAPPASSLTAEPWSIVVKVVQSDTCSLEPLLAKYALEEVDALLASRQVFLVQAVDPLKRTVSKADEAATKLDGQSCVVYAERNRSIVVDDNRFHAWPSGSARPTTETEWRDQPSTSTLGLAEAQALSTGAGVTVAVLDTGADELHPALAGRLMPGWDYVDDDADPYDELGGTVSGHGTFIAGVVDLVAPQATILPMRVLDAEGRGDGYRIAEAIRDSVTMGARVINLSLGTREKIESKVVTDTIKWARSKGVLTVAAAGNDGDQVQQWPAAQGEVVSVASLDPTNLVLAPYSTRGSWVDFAAIGTDLVSLMPTGGFDCWSGTSMATPVVAGQIALIRSVAPRLDAAKTEEKLRATARKLSGQPLHYGGINIPASIQRALG